MDLRGQMWNSCKATTFEPADCLVGWEAEMKKIDEEYDRRAPLPKLNPVAEKLKAQEAAAKKKAAELLDRKERLKRLARLHGELRYGEESDGDQADNEVEEEDEALGAEAVAAELLALEKQLTMLTGSHAAAAAAAAAAAGEDINNVNNIKQVSTHNNVKKFL